MPSTTRTLVAVRPGSALRARPRLFAALEQAFPVVFCAWEPASPSAAAVLEIAGGGRPRTRAELAAHGVPVLAVGGVAERVVEPEEVQLADAAPVDRRVRAIILRDRLLAPLDGWAEDEEVLAAAASGAVWLASAGHAAAVHRVRSVLPELADDEVLYALLSRRALAMVALVHFLRALPGVGAPARPLRAAIVFDDPNLRWRSYGFIDFRRLLEHADAHGYHAAMAMVPLDAGRAHAATVALFGRRHDRLSLVVHGNDHIDNELLSVGDAGAALTTAAQAVRRVAAFERRCGLRVDRVMMPPHGLSSRAMTRALGAVGFEALFAIHPRPWTSHPPAAPLLAGWRPGEFVEGCAVIPRIPLCSSDADIALRAFLDHPLVVYGHHEDLARGLEPLADVASRVNRLGDVRWTSVGEIARANHSTVVEGERVVVAPYARRVRLAAPPGTRLVTVSEPRDAIAGRPLVGWRLGLEAPRPFGSWAPSNGRRELDLRLVGAGDVDPMQVPAPPWRPWPRVRRAATEARDRARPLRLAAPRR